MSSVADYIYFSADDRSRTEQFEEHLDGLAEILRSIDMTEGELETALTNIFFKIQEKVMGGRRQ